MKAIIHIGHQKTGSKTFQEYLPQQRTMLSGYGIRFDPTFKSDHERGGYDNGLAMYAGQEAQVEPFMRKRFVSMDADSARASLTEQFEGWRRTDHETYVYSFEGLIELNEHQINAIAELFRPVFDEIEIAFVIRRQDRWMTSAYSTTLQHGRYRDRLFPMVAPDYLKYNEIAKRWANVFGLERLHIIRMEDYTDSLVPLMKMLRVPYKARPKEARANTSISEYGQRLLQAFNSKVSLLPEFSHMSADQKANVRGRIREAHKGRSRLPSAFEARAFYALFEEDNRDLAKLLGYSDEQFFDDDFSRYGDEPFSLSMDLNEARDAIRRVLETA